MGMSGWRGAGLAIVAALAVSIAPAAANPYIVVDGASGKVIAEEDATRPWYPASLTKLMTAYTVFRAIEDGRVDLGTPIVISQRAASMAPSKMGYPVGTRVTIDNALKMLMVKSANDIAVALAEGVSGSVESFVAEMNVHSRAIGMTQSRWVNPNGLPDDDQVSSARDMALLARAIKARYPQYAGLFKIHAIKAGKRVMRNHNALVMRYPGANGMKTGFICASGFNLVASANRGGRQLITVVLGATSARERGIQAAKLLEDGFDRPSLFGLGGQSIGSLPRSAYSEPTNIREDVCGKKRKARMAEAEDVGESSAAPANDRNDALGVLLNGGKPAPGQKAGKKRVSESPYLLAEYTMDPPVPVGPYLGDREPASKPALVAALEQPAAAETAAALLPPEKPLKPGAIMPSGEAEAANAYAASGPELTPGKIKRAGAIGDLPLFEPPAGGEAGAPLALPGQIASRGVDLAAVAPQETIVELVEVPMPPRRPKVMPPAAPGP
jgi:D-alanyl-D-alanine carboxypeptidase